ncbi:MAG: 1-(5-phosphoribosyl)-5-[(5-phosphoribosylamino)methylideneamino]imidazole-4-carboxamide isomerase [Alphaproteobacteria bacterium]|nr:1-(5-phosphoribosyl)-5-[(5-phosphoribosylamino)methylideneamino]imidazole-4-carboxamide isomerase [Alphaproteobacteria bacterium]
MDIFPAIDLQNGQCVRLTQGDFNAATIYETDPLRQAARFADAGACWLHLVDLDGARAGKTHQFDIIASLAKQSALKVQTGGGIRSAAMIEKLLAAGVMRVVVGSLAITNPPLVKEWLRRFGQERIVLALDCRLDKKGAPCLVVRGWQDNSEVSLWDLLETYQDSELKTILCTDVTRDGMMTGSNRALYKQLRERFPDLAILASGGVKDLDDLRALAKLKVAGAITGKALYEGHLDLAAALQMLAEAPYAR